jgi:hypothetical protein
MRAPALDNTEALRTELREVSRALEGQPATVATGEDGLEVVRVLAAAQKSLESNGARINL